MSKLSEAFNDSWERVQKNKAYFIDSFYEFFMESSPEIPAMFIHTDMAQQKKMLHASLLYITSYKSSSLPTSILEKLKDKHLGLNIQVRHYDIWMNCIIKSVDRVDPKFDKNIENAWRETFLPGLDFMKSNV
ncbi:MAG: hypothetical protein KC646_10040 [Candidatus Cloacimonetes bacterium]|nr:hypothetical protein [Candidatus Cloacimonadota bacterium]